MLNELFLIPPIRLLSEQEEHEPRNMNTLANHGIYDSGDSLFLVAARIVYLSKPSSLRQETRLYNMI
jgi:hypothetical protein